MEKTIRRYAGLAELDEIKAEEYRYWQSRPVYERTDAVSELTQVQYAMKGAAPDVPGLQRTLVRFERAAPNFLHPDFRVCVGTPVHGYSAASVVRKIRYRQPFSRRPGSHAEVS